MILFSYLEYGGDMFWAVLSFFNSGDENKKVLFENSLIREIFIFLQGNVDTVINFFTIWKL